MREVAETYLETMGDIPDAENINVQYTANQGEAVLTFVFATRTKSDSSRPRLN